MEYQFESGSPNSRSRHFRQLGGDLIIGSKYMHIVAFVWHRGMELGQHKRFPVATNTQV
jgi:hypothetical protein